MGLPAEEPVIKAMKVAVTAKRNGWHGRIDAPEVNGVRHTTVEVTRNDEHLIVQYVGNAYQEGTYSIFGKPQNLHCASVALEKLEAWPDVLTLFKEHKERNKPTLVNTYRRLPFDPMEAQLQEVLDATVGRKLFWYSAEYARLDFDVVLRPGKKGSDKYRIAPVGHRRLFHFMGAKNGFRSVLLDTVIKVG